MMRYFRCAAIALAAVSLVLVLSSFQTARAQRLLFDELHRMLPADNSLTYDIALGDVDGDGDQDVFMANDGQNRLYLNDGTGVFSDATSRIPAHDYHSNSVALGDVDGDGDLDALIGNGGYHFAQPNQLYLNDGAGVFTDASFQIPAHVEDTYSVVFGDVDGDGDLDAWIGNLGIYQEYFPWIYEPNRLYLNNGLGMFSDASSQIPYDISRTTTIVLGDVDGDGDLDAMIGNAFHEKTELALNDGTGFFSDATSQMPTDSDYTQSLTLGDVDGDGDLDVTVANLTYSRLYLNDGAGVFSDATMQFPASGGDAWSIALGDVDGDSDLDALIGFNTTFNTTPNRLLLNDGAGVFSDASSQIPNEEHITQVVAFCDADGDGDLDAFIGESCAQNRLYLNDGNGTFTDATTPAPNSIGINTSVAIGDVDNDGDLDAMMGIDTFVYNFRARNRLYLNNGLGGFTDATPQIPNHDERTSSVVLGDVDGDGDLDAFIGNKDYQERNRLYLNDGSGIFTDAAAQIPDHEGRTYSVVFGDVDGDGDLDVFIGNHWDPNRLYLNDGAGVFTDATSQIPADNDYTYAVALGDVEGDGDLDAFIGNSAFPSRNRLYLNDGAGVFTDATSQIPSHTDRTSSITLGDVDGDGDLDAFIGNGATGGNEELDRLYLNNGVGVFSDAPLQVPSYEEITEDVVLADVDNDGDLDAVVAVLRSQSHLFLNDGKGVFIDATFMFPHLSNYILAMALGDLDGDGDLDCLAGTDAGRQSMFYTNLLRQIAWRGVPRIGKPLVMDLFGFPNAPFVAAASGRTAAVLFPPYGTLWLDPGAIVFRTAGNLDKNGRTSLVFAVPPGPAIVGVSLYWQAAFGPRWQARLSNLEMTTFTDL
jgi:hypothetical protein